MARIFIDGFESGSADLWDTVGSSMSVGAAPAGMTGSYAIQSTGGNSNSHVIKNVTAAAEYYLSFLFRITLSYGTYSLCQFRYNTNILVDIRRNVSTGVIEVYRGTTLIASGSALSLNAVYHIQVRANIHDTTGIVQVKINDLLDVDFSGDTKPGTDTQINSIVLGQTSAGNNTQQFDDVVIDGSIWPGRTYIQAIRPTGAGNSTQWTPSAGSNWDCVDEIPASDVDNVVTNANDQVDLYAAGNLVGTIDSVVCVQIQTRAVKEGAATPQNLALGVRTGATDYFSSDKIIPTTARSVSHIWAQNPNTAAAWTKIEVDEAEIGIKSRA